MSPQNIAKIGEEAYRQSVLRLQAQERRMLAADQRSLVFAAVAVASSTFAVFVGSEDRFKDAALVAALLFILAAVFAVIAARATKVVAAHPKFKDFEQYLSGEYEFAAVLQVFGEQNDGCHEANEARMKVSNGCYNFSMFMYVLGLAFAAWGIVRVVLQG